MMFVILMLALIGLPVVQNPPAANPPAPQDASAVIFSGDAGIVLNYIKRDKAAEFEAVMAKVKEALEKSDVASRKQQAAGWKVVKSPAPVGDGQVLYLWIVDPAVKDADYSVPKILSEAFPTEARGLYDRFVGAYARGKVKIDGKVVLTMGQ